MRPRLRFLFRRAAARILTIVTFPAVLASGARAETDTALSPEPEGKNIATVDALDAVIPELEAAYWVVDSASPTRA